MRYLVVRYGGNIDKLVVTNEFFFWLNRGHFSNNGSGTICDLKSAGILAYKHYCKVTDTIMPVEKFESTSKAMDSMGFAEMLDEIVSWIEELDTTDLEVEPSFLGVVLDGDSSTDRFVEKVQRKAVSVGNESNFCKDLRVVPCTNHLSKNAGNKVAEIGKRLHFTCSCPVITTKANVERKDGRKQHRGVNVDSHPLVKTWQRALGAALRGASDWAKHDEFKDIPIKELAIQSVEEAFNHLRNVHEGPGFHTNQVRKCRLHPAQKPDGAPYVSSTYNDCPGQLKELQDWLLSNVIAKLEQILVPGVGAVSQNASERVGVVALQYRAKHLALQSTHYIAATDLALCHVQNIVIWNFKRVLAENGIEDTKIKEFGTFQRRLHVLLGLPYSPQQEKEWEAEATYRSKLSAKRGTLQYLRYRKKFRRDQKAARQGAKADKAHTYKGDTGGGRAARAAIDKGVAGACTCTATCARGCPCKAAGVHCSTECHGDGNGDKCKNHALETPAAASPAAPPTATPAAAGSSAPDFDDACPPPTHLDEEVMLGKHIYYHWDAIGWLQGFVCTSSARLTMTLRLPTTMVMWPTSWSTTSTMTRSCHPRSIWSTTTPPVRPPRPAGTLSPSEIA